MLMSKSLLSLFCRKNVRRRWFAVPYCIIPGRRMQFMGDALTFRVFPCMLGSEALYRMEAFSWYFPSSCSSALSSVLHRLSEPETHRAERRPTGRHAAAECRRAARSAGHRTAVSASAAHHLPALCRCERRAVFRANSLFYVTVWVYFFFGSLALPYLPVCGGTALCKNCGMPTAGLPRPRTPHGNTVCSIMIPTTSASPFPNVSAKEALSISPPPG